MHTVVENMTYLLFADFHFMNENQKRRKYTSTKNGVTYRFTFPVRATIHTLLLHYVDSIPEGEMTVLSPLPPICHQRLKFSGSCSAGVPH